MWGKTEPEQKPLEELERLSYIIDGIEEENKGKEKLLPPRTEKETKSNKLTVCFEMDDVFLHVFFPSEYEAYMNQPDINPDHIIDFPEYSTSLQIYLRDGFQEMFKFLKNETESVIFSQAEPVYIDKVMDILDPDREIFKHRFCQEHCNHVKLPEEGIDNFVKDLSLLGRDLSRTVLVDSNSLAFWVNPNNGIPIHRYSARTVKDTRLEELVQRLRIIAQSEDVRFDLIEQYHLQEAFRDSRLL